MIPPAGFKSEQYPLRHRLLYSLGLSCVTGTKNSSMLTLVKNYKTVNDPKTIEVNPHSALFSTETGAICNEMSIIDKLKLRITFNLTRAVYNTDIMRSLNFSWYPIFFSFPEKLDAADLKTTTTVASILSLTKDATQEDVTPAFGTKLPVVGTSDLAHPVTTVNATEVFGTLNLTTDTTMEAIPHNRDTLMTALKYYTNKGALKACMGKIRHETLTEARPTKSIFIDKFVPRAIRRIVPYTFFAIVVHVPIHIDIGQLYVSANGTADVAHLGIKAICTYDEWNPMFEQETAGV